MLAERPPEDTEPLRRQLLQGDMPAFAADLRLRAGVAGARRFAPREQRDDAPWAAVRHADWADPNAFAPDGESLAHWLFRTKDPAAGEHLALLHADPAEANFFGEAPTPTGR